MSRIRIINCTDHPITVLNDDNELQLYPPRMEGPTRITATKQIEHVNGIQIATFVASGAERVPPRRENTYYLVSSVVADHFPDRDDFLVPGALNYHPSGTPYCRLLHRAGSRKIS